LRVEELSEDAFLRIYIIGTLTRFANMPIYVFNDTMSTIILLCRARFLYPAQFVVYYSPVLVSYTWMTPENIPWIIFSLYREQALVIVTPKCMLPVRLIGICFVCISTHIWSKLSKSLDICPIEHVFLVCFLRRVKWRPSHIQRRVNVGLSPRWIQCIASSSWLRIVYTFSTHKKSTHNRTSWGSTSIRFCECSQIRSQSFLIK